MTTATPEPAATPEPPLAGTSDRALCDWDSLPNEALNFWTIGNVSEVLPGVIQPFTATLYQAMDERGVARVVDAIESREQIPPMPPPTANFIAYFAGRAALNLAWANAVIQVWQTGDGSDLLAQFVTSTDGQDIASGAAADTARAAHLFARIKRIWGQLPRTVAADRTAIERQRGVERRRDLSRLSEAQLWQLAWRLTLRSSGPFAHHLFVSGAAGEYAQWLAKLLDQALPGHDPALVIVLTSALRDVESAQPSKGAWDVARFIGERPALAGELERLSAAEIAAGLAAQPNDEWRALAERFAAFIDRFGFRGQREADPSAADWEEEPAFVVGAIKSYLHAGETKNPYELEEAAAHQRETVQHQVLASLPRAYRAEFRRVLAGAQQFTRLREASKANWVRSARPIRRPLRELARRLADRGVIAGAGDFWFLTIDDVRAAVRRTLTPQQARELVARRRATYARLEAYGLPEVFTTPVPVLPLTPPEQLEGGVLTGMPVSAGTATGRARVVRSAEAAEEVTLEAGEVLVAPYTDAPWTPLFVPAAAVVVETGGILSHASTVAREFGIPAVVAVKGATRLIKTGQIVTVDGNTGQVTVSQ